MRQKPTGRASSSEQIIRDIKRKTRKQYSAEEKIRIVLDGLRGEDSIAELCRREGIAHGTLRIIDRVKRLPPMAQFRNSYLPYWAIGTAFGSRGPFFRHEASFLLAEFQRLACDSCNRILYSGPPQSELSCLW